VELFNGRMIGAPALLEVPRTSNRSILRKVSSPKSRSTPTLSRGIDFSRDELKKIIGVKGIESRVGWIKTLTFKRNDGYFCVAERLRNGDYRVMDQGLVKYTDEPCTESVPESPFNGDVYRRSRPVPASVEEAAYSNTAPRETAYALAE
jgi:hypothetical protein